MAFELSMDPARVQLDVVHAFLASSYWSPGVRREVLERAVRHSLVIGAYEVGGGRQLGFARVVTDQATFAWLCDVFVVETHRGQGIAKAMVAALLEDPRLSTLRRWCLGTRDAHELYRPFGFQPVPAERWLEKLLPPSAWQERAG